MTTDGESRWAYVADRAPKPFAHPIHAPNGRVLTVESPSDHVWQRGLWFAIKFVDGDNFWEEVAPFGTQTDEEVAPGVHRIDWVRPDGTVALTEQRVLSTVDVGRRGAYAIDWTTTLAAERDLLLDRTPFTTWGGYGGLTFRGAPDWADTRLLLADGSEHRRVLAEASTWCDLSGPDAGVCMLDHPGNPRHPVPWYGASRSRVYGEGWANYFNAAFLFHEPLTLRPGNPLALRYRVVVHDGPWGVADGERAWHDWVNGEGHP